MTGRLKVYRLRPFERRKSHVKLLKMNAFVSCERGKRFFMP